MRVCMRFAYCVGESHICLKPQNTHLAEESWVTVSPKKRVKTMIRAKPRRNSMLNPETAAHDSPNTASPRLARVLDPAPMGPDGILLANPVVMQGEPSLAMADPLDALNAGGEADHNIDMYLNLQNLEDVEMSTDSSKRKRSEEGEEASSQGPH
uniref:Uncharacterized protein n=1 Tax=Opuntia streptacantha TaxID=393608 RepID=A0A7C9DPI7_OPUST